MMKKYFTDGLVQVAILFSLMRTDLRLRDYLNEMDEPEIQDIMMGQSSAYLQTSFRHQSRWYENGGSVSPKSAIERDFHLRDIIRDLARPRQIAYNFPPSVATWLVSEVTTRAQSSPSAPGVGDVTHGGAHTAVLTAQAPDAAHTNTAQDANELSKEDMEMIEVLWQQDIDLGVSKDLYNNNNSLLPESKKPKDSSSAQTDRSQALDEEATSDGFTPSQTALKIDQETGELERPSRGHIVIDDINMVQTESEEILSLEEVVKALEEHLSTDWPVSNDSDTSMYSQYNSNMAYQRHTAPAVAGQYGGVVATSFSPDRQAASYPSSPQVNYSQPYMGTGFTNYSFHMTGNASLAPFAPLQTWNNFTDYLLNNNSQTDVNYQFTAQPITGVSDALPPTYSSNSTMTNATNMAAPGLGDFDTAMLFPNISGLIGPPGLITVDDETNNKANCVNSSTNGYQTASMIDLLDCEDLEMMDLDQLNFSSDASSFRGSSSSPVSVGDSAVSMTSGSPLTVIGASSPLYDVTAGATGGHDPGRSATTPAAARDKAAEYCGNGGGYYYGDGDDGGGVSDARYYDALCYHNHSTSANETLVLYEPGAVVAHNHTYMTHDPAPIDVKVKKFNDNNKAQLASPRDFVKAKQLGLPLTYDEIIDIPVEDLASILQSHRLNEDQLQLIRDIRRRGKNKMAAQNCRKRRLQEIEDLEADVDAHRHEKHRLLSERSRLEKELIAVRSGYERLYDQVFRSLSDYGGRPYDGTTVSMEMNADGNFVLVPRNSSSSSSSSASSSSSDMDSSMDKIDFKSKHKK